MAKITDYRTESEKRRDALHEKIHDRYKQLRDEGLTHYRACVVTGGEFKRSHTGISDITKRFEAQQTN